MHSQAGVLRSALIAVVVGGLTGTAAGLWSVRRRPSNVTASAQVPTVEALTASPAPPAVSMPLPASSSAPAATPPPQGAPVPTNPLRRAGELARRADVRSLLALREEVAQRAASKGEQGPSETRRQLDEIERYLSEARALQLQRDAEELRRSEGGPAAPR